jgi:hypothetical protein
MELIIKTLRRTVIIRDSDLDSLIRKTVRLFDRFDVEPMTYRGIQQEYIMLSLRGEDTILPKFRTLPNIYEDLLWREKCLYDSRYLKWMLTMDYPDGQIYVQSTTRTQREPLHRVTFEKDY